MVDSLPENIVQAVVDNIPMHALGTPQGHGKVVNLGCDLRCRNDD